MNLQELLGGLTPTEAPSLVSVPNQFPKTSGLIPYRIAIIGDCPSLEDVNWMTCTVCTTEYPSTYYDSELHKYHSNTLCPKCKMAQSKKTPKPFVGKAGKFLSSLLLEVGIKLTDCYIGHVCQHKPSSGKVADFLWTGSEIQLGLSQLKQDLVQFQPNLILLLGPLPLRAARGSKQVKKKTVPPSIDLWRGSLFICDKEASPFFGFKCLPTYHPFSLFRSWDNVPITRFDLAKAKRHGGYKELPPTGLILDTTPNYETILSRLALIKKHRIKISVDIEGYVNAMSCLSISPTEKEAFIIPFTTMQGASYWNLEQESNLWGAIADVFEDPEIPKVLQNGMYDRFVLAYSYKLLVRNMQDDTLIKNWEIYSEFEKSLAFLTSIWTDHSYYKDMGNSEDLTTFWQYCCMDSAITNEISNKQSRVLDRIPQSNNHYHFNMSLSDPFLYIELKGMRLDVVKKSKKISDLKSQAWFDNDTETSGGTEQLIFEQGVGHQLNVNSSKEMCNFLYEDLKLPPIYRKRPDGGRSLTADYEALLTLGLEHKNPLLVQAIKVRRILKKCSGIEGVTAEPNGRVLSSINVVGSKTGRTSSSKAPTGKGTNLQTIPKDDRDMFIADFGHDFGQCDLEGADSWTVAAQCARLGDPTMLDDLLAGLKPAKILLAMWLRGSSVNSLSRPEIKTLLKQIADPAKYFICKGGSHGTNYRMGAKHLAEHIFFQTDGEIHITELEAKTLQQLYLLRYKGVKLWHAWIERELKTKGYIISASGSRRLFFGRKDASDTIGDACSTEPQHNTTYVTNLAMQKLWSSPSNRDSQGNLLIWPCHQVHDAICMQWKTGYRDQARLAIREFFNNPITIAGIRLTIPFEGNFGPSWGEQPEVL